MNPLLPFTTAVFALVALLLSLATPTDAFSATAMACHASFQRLSAASCRVPAATFVAAGGAVFVACYAAGQTACAVSCGIAVGAAVLTGGVLSTAASIAASLAVVPVASAAMRMWGKPTVCEQTCRVLWSRWKCRAYCDLLYNCTLVWIPLLAAGAWVVLSRALRGV